MFGALRLLLALLVALSHVGVSLRGYHLGVPAVVGFFLLSGYVIDALVGPGGPLHGRPLAFYGERAVRLLPPYALAAALGAAAIAAGVASPFLAGAHQPWLWLANAVVLPLNYASLLPVLDTLALVPPAWSLALELHFYLLAPWLLRAPARVLAAAATLTLVVASAAWWGWLPSDAWGYRLLAGNLYVFLSGAWLHRVLQRRQPAWPLWLAWAVVVAQSAALYGHGRWGQPFVAEVTLGYAVGLPWVAALARLPRQRWDDALAHLAYGVFLGHFAVLWHLGHLGWLTADGRPLAVYVAATLALAALLHILAERPARAWRHRLRSRTVAPPQHVAPRGVKRPEKGDARRLPL
jgi:peptidoglycan/LPS O-acetylase OafA/YrhL